MSPAFNTPSLSASVWKVVGGVATQLVAPITPPAQAVQFAAIVDSAGRWYTWVGLIGGSLELFASGQDSVLATGGTLASGKCGVYDNGNTSAQRIYDTFWCSAYTTDAAFYAGQELEIRSDRAIRQDITGSFWVPTSSYTGQYMKVPTPATFDGFDNVLVKASRNNPANGTDTGIDDIQAQVSITPRYSQIPNS